MLDASRIINGSFGQVFMGEKWLSNFNKMEANVEIQKAEIKLAGTRWTAQKVTGLKGTGTISGFKVTSDMTKLLAPVADDQRGMTVVELISKLADPESHGVERIRLKNVVFDKIPLANWESQTQVAEELAFTFQGFELLDPIEE
jgi:hypothetical protein